MEWNLSHIGDIKALLSRHGFTFSKALGQNFLINPSVCPRMAEMGGALPGCGIIEIGAGIGVLTVALAQRADKVVSIEIDKRLIPILEETLAPYPNVKVINEDVLMVDLARLISQEFDGMPVSVCANLPYYITSPIIMSLLEARLPIQTITVMVQKEAAVRICAAPGTRESGAISAAVHYFSVPDLLFPVSRGSFLPAPNVDSAVIQLRLHQTPPVTPKDETFFFRVIKAAFAQRRKTAVNSISSTLGISKQAVSDAMTAAGLSLTARAESLSLEEFCALSDALLIKI